MRGKIPSIVDCIMTTKIIKPKIIKPEEFMVNRGMQTDVKKNRGVIRKNTAKMLEFIKPENIKPIQVDKAPVQSGPTTSWAVLVIAPCEQRARKV